MDSNNFDDEIEELDEEPSTTQEISDLETPLETPEEYINENYDESYENSYNRPKFGEREYKNAKDENGHHDKDYYKKRGQELDEKVSKAKEEKDRDWKTDKEDADKNQNKENIDDNNKSEENKNLETKEKENLEHKPEEERQNKNKFDRVRDNYNLEKAKFERMQNKLDGIKAKTYQTMHPIEAAKEEAKEKVKDGAKAVGKTAAKATGRMVANGGKAVISFLLSNPIVLGALAAIIILFIIIFMLFSNPSDDEDLDSLGYFDTTCDFNLTTVEYLCPPYEENAKKMSLKDYVIGVAYGESEEENFSEAALKALMIIVKTNALAEGNYDNGSDKIVRLNLCNVIYEDAYEDLADEEENEAKSDKVKILEQYYNEINNFLFISDSYKREITSLGDEDALEYNDDIIEKLAETDKNGYEEILQEIYAVNDDEKNETIKIENDKPYLFIGDSRTVGMRDSVSELDNNNTVAESSKEYNWFVNNAISSANSIFDKNGNSYNIISWLGVNDAATRSRVKDYFNKYKELAEGDWSKHTIYVVSVGPVGPNYRYEDQYGTVITSEDLNEDINYFNDTMRQSISDAKISNLKFINLNYNITTYDTANLHYGNDDYKKIFSDIISKIYSSKTISKTRALFNNSEYCTYFNYSNGCDLGWWWPIGENGNFSKGAILRGDPATVSVGNGLDYGNRFHPIYHEWRWHDGEDLYATIGMNVIATRSGTIVVATDGVIDNPPNQVGEGCGNEIVIDHGDGFYTRYCHLTKGSVNKYSSVGMTVRQGQIIAQSGNSGGSLGPHLHFEIREGGMFYKETTRNPLDYINQENPRPTGNCRSSKDYSEDKEGICKALKDQGLSNIAVAAVLSNINVETAGTFDPSTNGPDGNGGRSWGLVQWHNTATCPGYDICTQPNVSGEFCNANAMKCYCKQNNMEWDTVECQISYLMKQVNERSYYSEVLTGNYGVEEMANLFCIRFEVAADCYPNKWSAYRTGPAQEFLRYVQNGCKE